MLTGSCEKIIFHDPGDMAIRSAGFEGFSKISFYDIFDVELRSDSSFFVDLETNEKYMDNIEISLDSGNLIFIDNNNLKWLPDYNRPRVTITFPSLSEYIHLQSPVNLFSSDTLVVPYFRIVSLGKTGDFNLLLNVDHFQIETGSDNSGYYSFKGRAGSARYWPRGSSIMDGSELEAERCYVYNNSIGDCQVNVTKRLEVRLNTMGNVCYYGNPEEIIIEEESGAGKLISCED
jgi:hypothetical protein